MTLATATAGWHPATGIAAAFVKPCIGRTGRASPSLFHCLVRSLISMGAGRDRPAEAGVIMRNDGRQDGEWEAWMAAAQAGDARAYDRLLRACLPFLRAIARRRIQHPAEAEDAVQDALLTIHQLRHAYDPARPIRPWLGAIAERRAIDRLRRHGRRGGRETSIDDFGETLASPGANTGEARVAAAELRAAVAALPQAQRTALRLAKLEDLSLAEASTRSGMSVGALKVATHRAVKALRQKLGLEN